MIRFSQFIRPIDNLTHDSILLFPISFGINHEAPAIAFALALLADLALHLTLLSDLALDLNLV